MPRNRRGRQGGRGMIHIPPYQAAMIYKRHFRFQNGSNNNTVTVQRGTLLSLIGIGDTNTIAVWRIAESCKLKKVEIWSPSSPSAAIGSTTISVQWISTLANNTIISDVGNAFEIPHIVTSPPKNSLAGYWSKTSTNESEVLFIAELAAGAVIDVWVDYVLQNIRSGYGEGSSARVVTGGSGGVVYTAALDFQASSVVQPIDCLTI
jgi:hypothetical protein